MCHFCRRYMYVIKALGSKSRLRKARSSETSAKGPAEGNTSKAQLMGSCMRTYRLRVHLICLSARHAQHLHNSLSLERPRSKMQWSLVAILNSEGSWLKPALARCLHTPYTAQCIRHAGMETHCGSFQQASDQQQSHTQTTLHSPPLL